MGDPTSHVCCIDNGGLNVSALDGTIDFSGSWYTWFWPRNMPVALRNRPGVRSYSCPVPVVVELTHGGPSYSSATVCGTYAYSGGIEYPYRKRYTDIRCINGAGDWRFVETWTVSENDCVVSDNGDSEPDGCQGYSLGDGYLDPIAFNDFYGRLYGWSYSAGSPDHVFPTGDKVSVSDALGYSVFVFTPAGGGTPPSWELRTKNAGCSVGISAPGVCTPSPMKIRLVLTVRKAIGLVSAYSLAGYASAYEYESEDIQIDLDMDNADGVYANVTAPQFGHMMCWWVASVSVKYAFWL